MEMKGELEERVGRVSLVMMKRYGTNESQQGLTWSKKQTSKAKVILKNIPSNASTTSDKQLKICALTAFSFNCLNNGRKSFLVS